MNEMLRKLTHDLVLSSSMVPPIFKKIDQTRDTIIFDQETCELGTFKKNLSNFTKTRIASVKMSHFLNFLFEILKVEIFYDEYIFLSY